jgi:hypothetical protein
MVGFLAAWVLVASVYAQAVDGVSVSTDSTSYAPGDPIQVTIANAGPDRVSRGGLACDDVWPLALEQLADDGTWQPVTVPRHQCIGITAALLGPGQSQVRTLTVSLDPGTYHLAYPFDDADTSARNIAYSDPFDIVP